ncbi:MAG TPA: ABC transporter permease [Acidimicrobiales bacterium]|nr:ABC transporter permease [Acidimicrobiales bacterium]
MASAAATDQVVLPPLLARLSASPLGRLGRAVRSDRKAATGLTLLAVFTFFSLAPGLVARDDPSAEIYAPRLGPSLAHLLGTNSFGEDLFAQVVYGTRESLVIAVVAGGLATVLSIAFGLTAASAGGAVDGILSLFTDVFLVIPTFPLIIVIAAYTKNPGDWALIAVLVVTGWSYGARTLRVQALSLANRDFVVAARLRGERTWRVICSELLPNMTSLIVANFFGAALYSVLAAAGIEFVGLGNPTTQSWGTMLYWAQTEEALQSGIPLWTVAPGVCVALLGAGFALLNYAFDEIGNPALRPTRRRPARAARGS